MAAKAEQKQTSFRSIFALPIAPSCLMSHLQKVLLFGLKRHRLSGHVLGKKNIRFASLTSHLLNRKLGKRIGQTIFSPQTKEGMKVNTTLRG